MRPARLNDAAPLGAFLVQSWKEVGPEALGFTGATDEAIKEIASEDFLRRRLSSARNRIVVAEAEGRILGFASVRRLEEGKGELSGIAVLKSELGGGLAAGLLRKAFEAAAKLGVNVLIVKTEVLDEKAIRFYEENGFTRSARTVEKVGREKLSLQVLEKRLRRQSRSGPRNSHLDKMR